MRKYYTRPCNFYYGNYAKHLVKIKKALPLAGNTNISFDQLEIFERKKGKKTKSHLYSVNEITKLNKDLKNIEPQRTAEDNDKEESSALGSLGLKPKPAL